MTWLRLLPQGTFYYLEHPLNNCEGIPFKYNENLDIIIKPGQTGFLILYGQLSLMVSPNAGEPHPTLTSTSGDGFRLETPDVVCAHGVPEVLIKCSIISFIFKEYNFTQPGNGQQVPGIPLFLPPYC